MKARFIKLWLTAALAIPFLMTAAVAQTVSPASSPLATLPDADVLIYISPQRLLNDAAPRVMPAKDFTEMRSAFADMKQSVGFDPATVEYLVLALRFHKPAGDLSFVAPDVLAVVGGDFSSESLFSLAQLTLQNKVRLEKHGSKTIALMRVDPIAEQAENTPLLKSLSEIGAVPLSANSLAIGNLPYLKSAIDAGEGTGRIDPATLDSLMRDPNVLMAGAGTPLASLAKAFGLFGTETTPREGCNTPFGNFYTAVTLSGTNFSVRGAMNADNPDTAKIISSLLSGLIQQGVNAAPGAPAQSLFETMTVTQQENEMLRTVMKSLKMMPKENEIVWEADIPQQVFAEIFKPKPPVKIEAKPTPAPRKRVRKKRTK